MPIAAPLTLAPLILAIVLVMSAIAKARDPQATLSSITLLRLPQFLRTESVAKALPIGEIVLAILMTSPFTLAVQASAVASLVLFMIYLVIIARAMRFNPRPSCGCFGRIGDQRVNGRTLARNVLFVALAVVFVLWAFAGNTFPAQLVTFGLTQWLWVLMAGALAAVAVFVSGGTFRSASPTPSTAYSTVPAMASMPSEGIDGIDADVIDDEEYIRTPIPQALLVDPQGQPKLLTEMAHARAQLLVFGNCYCGPTMAALRATPKWQERLPAVDVRYVFSGVAPIDPDGAATDATGWRDHASLTWQHLGLSVSPAAVLLGADGLLAGGPVEGIDELELFVDDIAEALGEADVPARGGHPIEGELVSDDR